MTLAENTLATTTARVYRTEFKSQPAEVNAGETVALVFTIQNAEGRLCVMSKSSTNKQCTC